MNLVKRHPRLAAALAALAAFVALGSFLQQAPTAHTDARLLYTIASTDSCIQLSNMRSTWVKVVSPEGVAYRKAVEARQDEVGCPAR